MHELLFPKSGYFNSKFDISQKAFHEEVSRRPRWELAFRLLSEGKVSEEVINDLIPWRKGPLFFGDGLEIEAEWNSELKWQRLGLTPDRFRERYVLDLGCGNSYYLIKALKAGARYGLGIDCSELCFVQSLVSKVHDPSLELGFVVGREDVLDGLVRKPDIIFCFGVLYHSRSPLRLLESLSSVAKSGTELFLETIVYDSPESVCLCPGKTYAGMRNVHFLPSVSVVEFWLEKFRFELVETGEIVVTSFDEQRSSKHAPFDSLESYVDSEMPSKTVEGHPRPARVVFKAVKR